MEEDKEVLRRCKGRSGRRYRRVWKEVVTIGSLWREVDTIGRFGRGYEGGERFKRKKDKGIKVRITIILKTLRKSYLLLQSTNIFIFI